jgi:HPt (histidine-containing phosphotransfer) domain-containing protein
MVHRTFGADLSLFQLLLPRMLAEFAEFAAPIVISLEDEAARNQLRGRTHKLKGSSGMLGAMQVMRLAGAAEDALTQGCAAAVVEAILAHLETLAHRAAVPAHAAYTPLSKTDIVELHGLLHRQNLAAVETFEMLSPSLREFLKPERFGRLKAAVDNLDFSVGARLLRNAAAQSLGEFAELGDVEFSSAMEQD